MSLPSLRPESIAVSAGRPHGPRSPLNTPIVLTAPYQHAPDDNHYSRDAVTDTLAAFEEVLGALEGGHALGFASGMAALTAVVESRPVGTVAVVPDAAYSGAVSIFRTQEELGRMTVRRVDIGDTAAVLAALDGADLLWLETVSNPVMAIPDIPVLAAAAHERGILVGVDATFSTPMVVNPLALGADVVMHSATKYLSGHSDVLMGALVTGSDELHRRLHERRTLTGAIPGALECYLATRGMRTLPLRMERAQANAADLAARLVAHPRVTRVRYPGLPDWRGHDIAARDFRGFGAMVCFEIDGTPDDAERLCESLQLINHATSLGGVESLLERRARYAVDAGFGTPDNLLRFSVGVEHVEDLWADLEQALSL